MQTFETPSASPRPSVHDDDREQPFLEVLGAEGSTLRADATGLTVCPALEMQSEFGAGERHWSFDELADVRLVAYRSVGVIRATISSTGSALPLLLLEPAQIPAARRTLEIVWNLMGAARLLAHPA